MDLIIIVLLFIVVAWVLLSFPWISLSLLIMVPLIKPAAVSYLSLFRIIDLTVMANILVGILGTWSYMRTRRGNHKLLLPWSLMICLGVVCLIFIVGQFWTTAPLYGAQKTQRMIGIGLPFLILPALFIRSNKHAMGVMYALVVVSGIVAVILLFGPDTSLHTERYGSHFGRKTFFGSDPNTPAVVILIGVLAIMLALMAGVAPKWMKLYSIILIPLGIAAILASGSRANLLGLTTSFLFIPFLMKGRGGKNLFKILVSLAVIIVLMMFLVPAMDVDIPLTRWLGFMDQLKEGDLTSTRTPAWIFCITEAWDKHVIFGHGPGSYAKDFLGEDIAYYPHNIVLEALYEAGVIGAIAILAFFRICYSLSRRGMRLARTPQERFIIAAPGAIVLAMSVTALTHWNLDSARFLYLFAGILAVTVYSLARQITYEKSITQQSK